jgi:hypothetical protein
MGSDPKEGNGRYFLIISIQIISNKISFSNPVVIAFMLSRKNSKNLSFIDEINRKGSTNSSRKQGQIKCKRKGNLVNVYKKRPVRES